MNEFGVVQDIIVRIEDRHQTVTIAVDFHPKSDYYFISALTDTGFDLIHAYFTASLPRNTRLRSENSIANEMQDLIQRYATAILDMQSDIILTQRTITVDIHGEDVYTGIKGIQYYNVTSVNSKQSGKCISWYYHNVFNSGDLEVEIYRNKEGSLRMRADENKLYDFKKLRALYDSDAFQNSKYSFFFYNEVRRLLNIPVKGDPARMSGLFNIGIQE